MKWISIKDENERCPLDVEVLLCTYDGKIFIGWREDEGSFILERKDSKKDFFEMIHSWRTGITHWAYLSLPIEFSSAHITNDEWVTNLAKQGLLKNER